MKTHEFVERAELVHGPLYDYSRSVYVKPHEKNTYPRPHSANRYSTGNVYRDHGFVLVKEHPYTLAYTNGKDLFSRHVFQKQNLKGMVGYSEEKTADEILAGNGIFPIYGAGTKTWEAVVEETT